LLRVRSYDVVLDLTGEESFGSVSVIRFDCAEPGATSHADLVAQAVHEISLNGARRLAQQTSLPQRRAPGDASAVTRRVPGMVCTMGHGRVSLG